MGVWSQKKLATRVLYSGVKSTLYIIKHVLYYTVLYISYSSILPSKLQALLFSIPRTECSLRKGKYESMA